MTGRINLNQLRENVASYDLSDPLWEEEWQTGSPGPGVVIALIDAVQAAEYLRKQAHSQGSVRDLDEAWEALRHKLGRFDHGEGTRG